MENVGQSGWIRHVAATRGAGNWGNGDGAKRALEGRGSGGHKEEAGGAKGEGKARFTGRGGEGDLGGGG